MVESHKERPAWPALQNRLQKLAAGKARLELMMHMMTHLSGASGLDDVIDRALQIITRVIGATNTMLFLQQGGEYLAADVYGKRTWSPTLADPLVREAYAGAAEMQTESAFADTLMTYPTEDNRAFTWFCPLCVGPEVIGVIRIEHTAYNLKAAGGQMDVFWGYLAQVLKNEIQNRDHLQAAYAKLQRLNARLEDRVARRTFELEVANRALLESEARYRSILESTQDGVYICTPDLRISYCNPAMFAIFGRDVTGERCYTAVNGLDAQCPACPITAVLQGQQITEEKSLPGRDRIYHVSCAPLLTPDGSVSKLTVYRDVTRLKEMEQRLRQVQRMESIGNLAGGIAHDFNNLLFPITGMAELLMEDLPPNSLKYLNAAEILKAGLRGRDLVQQILSFSRQSTTEKKPVRLDRVLQEALKLCRAAMPANVAILEEIRLDDGLVKADESQLHQVVMNVVMNAFQSLGADGGRISVRLTEAVRDADGPPDERGDIRRWALLEIDDTGCGIAPEHIRKVLEPYFTTREKERGTGLGLAVAYGIVKEHHGEIGIESEPGMGTTIRIRLPLMARSAAPAGPRSPGKHPTGAEHILLVDDEAPILSTVQQMLQRLGYRVTAHADPQAALAAFRENRDGFDLVVTDMTMPDLTGDRLAAELRALRPALPVILCTGYHDRIDREQAQAAGINGFLMKPVERAVLAQQVRAVLDGARDAGQG